MSKLARASPILTSLLVTVVVLGASGTASALDWDVTLTCVYCALPDGSASNDPAHLNDYLYVYQVVSDPDATSDGVSVFGACDDVYVEVRTAPITGHGGSYQTYGQGGNAYNGTTWDVYLANQGVVLPQNPTGEYGWQDVGVGTATFVVEWLPPVGTLGGRRVAHWYRPNLFDNADPGTIQGDADGANGGNPTLGYVWIWSPLPPTDNLYQTTDREADHVGIVCGPTPELSTLCLLGLAAPLGLLRRRRSP